MRELSTNDVSVEVLVLVTVHLTRAAIQLHVQRTCGVDATSVINNTIYRLQAVSLLWFHNSRLVEKRHVNRYIGGRFVSHYTEKPMTRLGLPFHK